MIAASWPRADRARARLMTIDRANGSLSDRTALELPAILRPGDLLVVNDAATLPASLSGQASGIGAIELRLLDEPSPGSWNAVAFSAGNWRVPTERRAPPPLLPIGSRLELGPLTASVSAVSPLSPRLVTLRFDQTGAAFWAGLYRAGTPVQYSYLSGPLRLWHVQNTYAARPFASEAPSAGFVLTGQLLADLLRHGIGVAALTHAAGLSATGDAALDAALPLGERYDIPAECVERIRATKARGGRVIAVGTSVVRSLESRALDSSTHDLHAGELTAGAGQTELRIGPGFRPRVVDGLLSGIHDPSASHYALLEAFVARAHLDAAHAAAERWGYLEHEFGDVCLLL
jgi:S-adenosylmethionine:tRNA ribosyltransferase-isomerase